MAQRRLLVNVFDSEVLFRPGTDAGVLNLGAPYDVLGDEWRITSHTQAQIEDGRWMLSTIVEAPDGVGPHMGKMGSV